MVVLLENPVRSYAWGSPTVIPDLLGLDPTGEPQAELWVGAHPGSPSIVAGDGRTLGAYVEEDPERTLGAASVARFGTRLPYLLKILAIERPLSIQVHPTIPQAEAGYDAEDEAGVALDSPKRSYHDRQHKPEMVVALTDFEALIGFREPSESADLLDAGSRPELVAAAVVLRESGLQALATEWLVSPEADVAPVIEALTAAASDRRDHPVFGLVHRLAEQYPGDRGLLLAMLMLHIQLEPGEAAFVGAGVPHAYVSGVAVEPQASSDNTLRGGLTPKHVDPVEVLRLLRFEADGGVRVVPVPDAAGEDRYPVPGIDEFRLSRIRLGDARGAMVEPSGSGPRVVLVVDGDVLVTSEADPSGRRLGAGQAAFIPALDGGAQLSGRGTAFTVTPDLPEAR